MKNQKIHSLSACICAALFSNHTLAAPLVDIGFLPGGSYSVAELVSADGSVIVGLAFDAVINYRAFKYDGTTMTSLGTIGSFSTTMATALSADGLVIVGNVTDDGQGGRRAFKYVGSTLTLLGTLPGGWSSDVRAVSSDGSVIVGQSSSSVGLRAYKYVGGTMTSLGALPGGTYSEAVAVSADGTVIAGNSNNRLGQWTAFKYVGTTMTPLGFLPGFTASNASLISSNGLVIVGSQDDANGNSIAFKYEGTTMTSLGTFAGGWSSSANAVSADGSVIVGNSDDGVSSYAFKYVNNTLINLGLLAGGTYSNAVAVSADGTVIAGTADDASGNNRAFKYVGNTMTSLGTLSGGQRSEARAVSADGSIIVGRADDASGNWHAFLYRTASSNASLVDVNNTNTALAMNGYQQNAVMNSQSRLLTNALNHDCQVYGENGLCVSVGGAYNTVNQASASQANVSLSVGYQVTPHFRVGGFVDQTATNSMPSNYDLKNNMPLLGAFASWMQNDDGLGAKVKASVAYGQRDVNISRTTLADTEAGKGESAITSQGAQLEGAYAMAFNDRWVSEPFAGLRLSQISRKSYQENNVDFPIHFNAVNQTATTAYVGARFIGAITPRIRTSLAVGVEHDIHQQVSDYTGTIYTLGDFSQKAPTQLRTRATLAAGVDYAISPAQAVNAVINVNQQALNNAVGASAMVNYTVGF